jgi:hypothetical protein
MKKLDWRKRDWMYVAGITLLASITVFAATQFLRPAQPALVIRIDPSDTDEITAHGTITRVKAPDGTVLEIHTPYSDGGVGHQYFRADGTLRETKEHYPVRSGSSEGVLKSKGTFAADGKKLELGEAFRPDGSLWFTIKDLGDDKREETYYFPDGWKFSSNILKKGQTSLETTYFHRNGNVWATEEHERTQWGSYNEKVLNVFDASGKHKLYKVNQVGYNETVDGFNPGNWGRLVTFYNSEGKRSYRQWSNNYWNSFLGTQGNLLTVHVFDTSTDTISKTYEIDDGGQNVKVKSVSHASGAKKVFRDFGTTRKVSLEKFNIQGQVKERFLVQGTCSYEIDAAGVRIEHEDAERIFETIDTAHLARQVGEIEFREKRTQSQAESKGILGARDDSDPVKWYHKQ